MITTTQPTTRTFTEISEQWREACAKAMETSPEQTNLILELTLLGNQLLLEADISAQVDAFKRVARVR